MSEHLSDDERIGRLEGIQQHLKLLENLDGTFLHMPNLFDVDPVAAEPFVLSNSFIPERIGGSVRVIERRDGEREPLETENLNQMLGSFLPGGFKQRWRRFDLWQGTWDFVHEEPGTADIGPMFEFEETLPLSSLLGDDADHYTTLDVRVDEVTVYIPSVLYVERLDRDTEYYWSIDFQTVVAAHSPPGRTVSLGRSDPTTNYLWFRHRRDDLDGERTPLSGENNVITSYRFDDNVEFLRCYYASLLTLYEKENNDTLSRTLEYINAADDSRAFVASSEQSQLLQFELNRSMMRDRLATVLADQTPLRRDLQFAKLHRDVWDRLFFEEEVLENVFEVGPFIDHMLAVDYQCRTSDQIDADSVFEANNQAIETELERLLEPGDGPEQGPLSLVGYEPARESSVLNYVRDSPEVVATVLEGCAYDPEESIKNRGAVLDFAEEVLVHSVEHALSMWTADEAVASGSFELWYDSNFQGRDGDTASVGIYDSIQGGAGVATEVHSYLSETDRPDLDAGVVRQAACHTAATDQAVLDVLASGDGEALYELFHEAGRLRQHEHVTETELPAADKFSGFQAQLIDALSGIVGGADTYNYLDLVSHVENRVQALFETRELARFNAYVASEHQIVADAIDRTPRAVDLLLHLDQHLFTDPRVRETYRRFADDRTRGDLSELGERLEEVTLQCIAACPDCLETDRDNCIHGAKYQTQLLDRRLLAEVCTDDS